MAMPAWLSQIFGVIGTIGFMLMMTPQVVENAINKSTEGLSMGLILMWHAAALLSCAFFLCSDNGFFMVLSMGAFALCCSIIEGQAVGYRQSVKESHPGGSKSIIVAVSLVAVVLSIAMVAAAVMFFMAVPSAKLKLGDVTPSILLGAGFLPQYYAFCSSWSIKGYSFGVTALDVIGSMANTLVLFSPPNVDFAQAASDAAPFVVIICFHAGLVTLAIIIKCSSKAEAGDYQNMDEKTPVSLPGGRSASFRQLL
eukprot:TRINITY_DN41887_c0_g1_i1.p1 TRINITY_DN41887_c0_g1~~TRINITY_DN41887_c0_g1_i1.p1  ORF type:complete len:283 (+),score=50.81 TRINITY_DN41887_c0_g1_i1:89-850(+)